MSDEYEPGEAFVYRNGDRYEIGIVKRRNPHRPDCYFCWYHTGDTAANTNVADMHKVSNLYAFRVVRLDPDGKERRGENENEPA